MGEGSTPPRLAGLPRTEVLAATVPVATTFRSRLLGLALLDRESAGPGLLIPRCRAVHTFGMRFPLIVVFIDEGGEEVRRVRLRPRRFSHVRSAVAVLELPADDPPPVAIATSSGQRPRR